MLSRQQRRRNARLPWRAQAKHVKKDPAVSFRPKGEIFLAPSNSLGMMGQAPLLGGLCAFARVMF